MSLIFRQVFGDADMMTRVRPVLQSELGYADGPLLEELHMLQDFYNNPAYVAQPHPANYYFYGGGGSAYYLPSSDKSSASAILNAIDLNPDWIASIQRDTEYLKVLGLKHVAYAGGPALYTTGDPTTDANLQAAHDSPQMGTVVSDNQTAFEQNGGDLLVYYELVGDYQFSFMDDVLDYSTSDPSTYKYQAVTQMATQPAATTTYGTAMPTHLTASAYEVPPGWAVPSQPSATVAGGWYGFTVFAPSAGTYQFALSAGCADANGNVELWIDGVLLHTFNVANTGDTATFTTGPTFPATLTAGTHGLYVRGAAGTSTVGIDQILITQ
jgi:hypothetical protein